MIIGEIFQDDINRKINGVVKVDQNEDDVLVQELEEYVITKDLKKHFITFFNSYSESFEDRTADVGVWISGFFGSGKSHFLKILSYLLANKEVKGVRSVERFRKKFEGDPGTFMTIESVTRGHTDTILFNIDTEGSINKDKTAVLRVFAKMFYNYLGFYGEDLKVAKLEQFIDSNGKTEEFRRVFEEKNGGSWLESRDAFAFYEDDIVETLQEVLGMSETAAHHWFDGTETVETSISKLVSEMKAYVDSKPADFRLLFMVDEVGQYVGGDTDLLLNLQSLVEKIGSECGGKVWVICTGQEAIDEIIKARENEFSRIQARFKTRLSLTSSSADEVIQKRILKKKIEVEPILGQVYNESESVLRNLFSFSDALLDIKGYSGEKDFIKNYPFVPYQFIIMQKVFSEIRKHGNSGKHLSGGERSMLSGFQEAAQKIQDKDETSLAPFYLFYDTVHTFLDSFIRRVIERCQKAADNGDGIEPQDVNVLKLLYLIRYVEDIPANLDNIVILMADKIGLNKVAMREEVRSSLNRLHSQNYIGRSGGDTYNFLTDEEQDIQRDIYKNTQVDTSAIVEHIGNTIFADIYEKKKFRAGIYDYVFDRFVDNTSIGTVSGGIKLRILTAATDATEKNELSLTTGSKEQAIVVLADTPYYGVLENALKVSKYVKQRNIQQLPESVQMIIRHHQSEANHNEKVAKEELEKAIIDAKFYVDGEHIEIKSGDAKGKLDQAMEYLVRHVYNEQSLITKNAESDADILAVLHHGYKNGVIAGMEPNREAAAKMEEFLEVMDRKRLPTSMADIQKRYQSIPYGWKEIDVALVAAMLIYDQKVIIKYSGEIIQADNPKLPDMLRKKTEIGKTSIAKRQMVGAIKLRNMKLFVRDYFDVMDVPNNEDDLVQLIIQKFKNDKENFENLLTKYKEHRYPDKELVEESLRLIESVLSQESDHIALIDKILKEQDNLLDNKEDRVRVTNFFDTQVQIYDAAVKLVDDLHNDRSYLKHEEKAFAALEEIEQIIEDETLNIYRRIPELNELMTTVKEGRRKLLSAKYSELFGISSQCMEEIKNVAGNNAECAHVLREAEIFFGKKNHAIGAYMSLTILDGMAQQMWTYRDETIAKLQIAKNPKPIQIPESSESTESPLQPKRKKNLKTVYRRGFPAKVLENEADIDAYVEQVRKYLKEMLKDSDGINLN